MNCEKVTNQAYDYYGEASGELICKKIVYLPDIGIVPPPGISPVFAFLDSMSQRNKDNFINYVCYCEDLNRNWDKEQIKYKLYNDKQKKKIKTKFSKVADESGYSLDSDFDVLKYIYY